MHVAGTSSSEYIMYFIVYIYVHVMCIYDNCFERGLCRENAIAIESEANDSFGGNVYYVTMQITLPIP